MKNLNKLVLALALVGAVNIASANCGNDKDVGNGCSGGSSVSNNTNNNTNQNYNVNNNTNSAHSDATANAIAASTSNSAALAQGGDATAVAHGGEGGQGGQGGAGGNSSSSSTSQGSSSSSNSSQTNNQTQGNQNVTVVNLPTIPLGYETIGAVSGSIAAVGVYAYGGQGGTAGVAAGIVFPLHSGGFKHAKQQAVQLQKIQLQTAKLQMLSICDQMHKLQGIVVPACSELYNEMKGRR